LGYSSAQGWGLRGRAWWFQDSNSTSIAFDPGTIVASAAPLGLSVVTPNPFLNTGSMSVSGLLRMHIFDGEFTEELHMGWWDFLIGGGARYARLRQEYQAVANDPTLGTMQTVQSVSKLDGVGPVISAEAQRRFGTSGLSFYALGRGSLLFGINRQNVNLSAGVETTASRNANSTIPVGEVEAGLQYTHYWTNTWRTVLRVGCFAQTWWGIGNSSNSSPVFNGLGGVESNAHSNENLTLLGLNVMAGIEF
jgi:hypothetical protein